MEVGKSRKDAKIEKWNLECLAQKQAECAKLRCIHADTQATASRLWQKRARSRERISTGPGSLDSPQQSLLLQQ